MTALDEAAGMTFRMPALGQGVTECAVTRWLKGPGERIEEDEPLLEVATDKVDTEIPSPGAGVIARMMADENGRRIAHRISCDRCPFSQSLSAADR